ncbi:MAG: hypothetical protein GY850_24200 [bacterium]|nr:hypothetical protein [bacterium]
MHQVLKLFFLFICIVVAAFFANYYGYVSVPWLEINSVPTYGSEVKAVDDAVKQVIEDGIANKP